MNPVSNPQTHTESIQQKNAQAGMEPARTLPGASDDGIILPPEGLQSQSVCPHGDFEKAALPLIQWGWFVLPVDPADKRPMASLAWSKASTNDPNTIKQWAARWPHAMVGIDCKKSGLLVVDVDVAGDKQGDANWQALLAEHGGELPECPVARTQSRGWHFYFQNPLALGNATGDLPEHIDIRGAGGYVVAPGSVGSKGAYTWDTAPNGGNLNPPPHWLVTRLQTPKTQAPPMRLPLVQSPSVQASERIKQARQYLAKIPPAISGQGGHGGTYWAARVLVLGFDLTQAEARPLLHEWSAQCSPPWTPKEIDHKLNEADTKPFDKPRGWLLKERPPAGNVWQAKQQANAKTDNKAKAKNKPPARLQAVQPPKPCFDPAKLFTADTDPAREYFQAVATFTQTPMEMVSLLGLAVASGTLANVIRIAGFGDYIEPTQIWALVLSPAGTRKSAIFSELVKPIQAWEKTEAEKARPAIAKAKAVKATKEKELHKAQQQVVAGKASTDDVARLAEELEAMEVPTPPMLLVSEPTPEALALQMAQNQGRALLGSAEADSFDIIQGRYSGGARNYGILLKGHAGDLYKSTRIGRDSDHINNPALAVALVVQPEAVREIWNDSQAKGRGLLARFAVMAPDSRLGYRVVRPDPVDPVLRAGWRSAIHSFLALKPSNEPCVLKLSPEADRLLYAFQEWAEVAMRVGGDLSDRHEWGGKFVGLSLRIAGVLHALGQWSMGGKPAEGETIQADTMQAAIAWCHYLADCERDARERIALHPENAERLALLQWLKDKGGATIAELTYNGLRQFRQKRGEAEAALQDLVDLGLATWEQPPQNGPGQPKAKRCVPVPGVDETNPAEDIASEDIHSHPGDWQPSTNGGSQSWPEPEPPAEWGNQDLPPDDWTPDDGEGMEA